jgi:hypothetical protein
MPSAHRSRSSRGEEITRRTNALGFKPMSDETASEKPRKVGYCSPPVERRFPKGVSGNSGGRPRGSGKRQSRPHFYDELVPFTENGRSIEIPRGELLIRRAEKLASDGDGRIEQMLLAQKKKFDAARAKSAFDQRKLTGIFKDPESPPKTMEEVMARLGMAAKLYVFRSTARMALEPWIVQMALGRLGDRTLTRDQQEVVVSSTRSPHKVKFPDWWAPDLRGSKRAYRKR